MGTDLSNNKIYIFARYDTKLPKCSLENFLNPCRAGGILGYHSNIIWWKGGIRGYQQAIFR